MDKRKLSNIDLDKLLTNTESNFDSNDLLADQDWLLENCNSDDSVSEGEENLTAALEVFAVEEQEEA